MKILFVEDDLKSAQLFQSILETEGYEVTHSTHAVDGLRFVRQHTFDAIILDINLPDLDGAAAGLAIRRLMPNVPIIALTANADKSTRDRTKAYGFNAFIAKPCTADDLLSTLSKLIHSEKTS